MVWGEQQSKEYEIKYTNLGDTITEEWYENGQKSSENTYKDGKWISEKEWNEDGSVKE